MSEPEEEPEVELLFTSSPYERWRAENPNGHRARARKHPLGQLDTATDEDIESALRQYRAAGSIWRIHKPGSSIWGWQCRNCKVKEHRQGEGAAALAWIRHLSRVRHREAVGIRLTSAELINRLTEDA